MNCEICGTAMIDTLFTGRCDPYCPKEDEHGPPPRVDIEYLTLHTYLNAHESKDLILDEIFMCSPMRFPNHNGWAFFDKALAEGHMFTHLIVEVPKNELSNYSDYRLHDLTTVYYIDHQIYLRIISTEEKR